MLPNIEHTTATKRPSGATAITADEGYVFYDKNDYVDFTDEEGNPREPLPEEYTYSRYGVYAPETDFEHRIVVVEETEEIKNQIF